MVGMACVEEILTMAVGAHERDAIASARVDRRRLPRHACSRREGHGTCEGDGIAVARVAGQRVYGNHVTAYRSTGESGGCGESQARSENRT